MSRSMCEWVFETERNRFHVKSMQTCEKGRLQHIETMKNTFLPSSHEWRRERPRREREREREGSRGRERERDGDKRARHSFHIKCLGYSSTKVYFIKVMPSCSKRDYLSKRPRSLSQASNSFWRTRTHALIEERKTHADEFWERPVL